MTVSLYIHIPFCKSKCSYCDFFSVASSPFFKKGKINDLYIDFLLSELKRRKKQFGIKNISTIYVGGGTPSLLTSYQIKRLFAGIKNEISVLDNCETTVECNPDDITKDFLLALIDSGVNRISVGLQDMQDKPLKTVCRRCSREINLKALDLIKNIWVCNNRRFSVDFIAGLPFQTKEMLQEGIKEVIKFGVDHISLYSLTLEEGTALYNSVEKKQLTLPDSDEWWILARKTLQKMNFFQYEVSNFCKKNCESIHNSNYWKIKPYLGIGAGATGTIFNYRYTNSQNLFDWALAQNDFIEVLPIETQIFEFLMMGFRTLEGVCAKEFFKRFGKNIESFIEPVFSDWKNKNLATKNGDNYALNQEGILFLNSFLEKL